MSDDLKLVSKVDLIREPGEQWDDLAHAVASYFRMYGAATNWLSPYISRTRSSSLPFMPPERQQLKAVIKKPAKYVDDFAYAAFIDGLVKFCTATKGSKTLITPTITSHHSAQYCNRSFNITKCSSNMNGTVFELNVPDCRPVKFNFWKGASTVDAKFVIIRPKMGKLGMPSADRWEALLFKPDYGYLVEHTDSELNPRWSGIL